MFYAPAAYNICSVFANGLRGRLLAWRALTERITRVKGALLCTDDVM